MVTNLLQYALKISSKRVNRKKAEATGDLIGNKIAYRTTNVSKNAQQNNSETVIEKYLKKDIYLQKKDKKLLTIWYLI